jgi:DNA-binding CsgD family transcriptional regulator
VLMDMSLRTLAIDRGASAILHGKSLGGLKPKTPNSLLPKAIMDTIGACDPRDLSSTTLIFQLGSNDYTCRAYLMETDNGFPAMIALHIEKITSTDAISAVAEKYNLTEREQETLRGIAMGLSSKELAGRMNISPNTVKVFVRLIMIKMGVSTRGAIISQLLQRHSAPASARAACSSS